MKALSFLLTSMLILLVSGIFLQAQDCKVLLESISAQYEGECKNGLAEGIGVAEGIDKYSGKFKNGLPHGTGQYTWQSGEYYIGSFKNGKKSGLGKLKFADGTLISEGLWKDDEFFQEKKVAEYKIKTQRNVMSVTLNNLGTDANRIEVVLVRDGRESTTNIFDLLVSTTSCTQMDNNNSLVFLDASYPFNANIKFKAAGRMSKTVVQGNRMNMDISQMLDCFVEFEILEKGSWEVRVRY